MYFPDVISRSLTETTTRSITRSISYEKLIDMRGMLL